MTDVTGARMTELRAGLPLPPARMRARPLDERGYPVPYFVAYVAGKPDFRVIEPERYVACVKHKLCWLCGEPLGRHMAFVIGPMCAVNRVSSEPPSHRDCAIFAAQACPFLTLPKAHRRDANLPEHGEMPGIGLTRNPGVTLIWITSDYHVFQTANGPLFELGPPLDTLWYAEGRPATREEVLASIASGLPHLVELAEAEGQAAKRQLAAQTSRAMELVPEA